MGHVGWRYRYDNFIILYTVIPLAYTLTNYNYIQKNQQSFLFLEVMFKGVQEIIWEYSGMYDPATKRVQNSLFVHRVVPPKFRNCEIPGRTGGYVYKNGGFRGVQKDTWEYWGIHRSTREYITEQRETWGVQDDTYEDKWET